MTNKTTFYCKAVVKCLRGNHPVKEDVIQGSTEEVAAQLLLKYGNTGATGGLPTKLAGAVTEWYAAGSKGFDELKGKQHG